MPYYEDEVYLYFKSEIENSANAKMKALKDEIDSIKEKQLGIIDEEIHDSIFVAMEIELNEMNLDFAAQTNRTKLSAHKEVIKRKRNLLDSVLLEVENRCIKFVSTKKYYERMVLLVKKINTDFCGESILFKIKINDAVMKEIITNNFTNKFEIQETEDIKLGGFKAVCLEKGILTDQTVDYKLAQKGKLFNQDMKFAIKE